MVDHRSLDPYPEIGAVAPSLDPRISLRLDFQRLPFPTQHPDIQSQELLGRFRRVPSRGGRQCRPTALLVLHELIGTSEQVRRHAFAFLLARVLSQQDAVVQLAQRSFGESAEFSRGRHLGRIGNLRLDVRQIAVWMNDLLRAGRRMPEYFREGGTAQLLKYGVLE